VVVSNKLALGTAQFGMSYGIANKNGKVPYNEISAILEFAMKNEITTLDTAKAYGDSEKVIGQFIAKNPSNKWKVITKLSSGHADVIDQIKDSTVKLNIAPVVTMAHSAKLFLDDKFQSELLYAKERKNTLKTGVSIYNKDDIYSIFDSSLTPDIIQIPMNILDTYLYKDGVLSDINKKGIEIHIRSVFLQGLFYLSDIEINKRFYNVKPYLEKLKSIASKSDLTLAELSLLWVISLKEISKVVIGVDNISQLKSHLDTLSKNVDDYIFEEALSIQYKNENVLNPSLWQ